ncbi:MAG: hypothetical protein ACI841_003318 [Planctomycetota bacterium]|jgi:hypothetical protein
MMRNACRRTKGKPRKDGGAVRTYYYGCGNYIRKGRAACRFGSVNQEKLEQLEIETVLTYYERYHGEEGRRALAEVVLDCVGTDSADLAEAKQTATHRLEEIGVAFSRLLDALTDGTRPFVEERLQALDKDRRGLETKLRGLEELELSRADRMSLVEECRGFVHDLPGALNASSPEVRVRTMRRCVERIVVDREAGAIEPGQRGLHATVTSSG